MTGVRITHIGGPTTLIEVNGWRLLYFRPGGSNVGPVSPRTAVPLHYEGWKYVKQGREAIEREFAQAPEDIRRRIRWLPIGAAVELRT